MEFTITILPLRYLGVPLIANPKNPLGKKINLKLSSKVNNYNFRDLNLDERVVFMKEVL